MNAHTASLVLVYAVVGAPTSNEALACAAVLPYAEYSPMDDPLREIFYKWTGNPISPRTLAATGHRDVLRRMDKRAVLFDADGILLDAVMAGDIELVEWFLNEFGLDAQRQALTTWGTIAEGYCTVAARNGRVDFLAWWWPQLSPHDQVTYQSVVDRVFNAAGDLAVLQWLETTVRADSSLELVLPNVITGVVCRMAGTGSVAAMDWIMDHGVETMTADDWFRVAVRASAKSCLGILDWIWDRHGTEMATTTFGTKGQQALMVDASARSDLLVLDYWLSKYRLHPQLFNFTLLGQRKVLAAAARNNRISCLEWWLERAEGNVHTTGWTKSVRKNRSKTGIVFPLKCHWFGPDWGECTTISMLEWWHDKCAEYGEPWIAPYLSDLARTGSTDVLDWAWDHKSRWLDFESRNSTYSGPYKCSAEPPGYGMYPIAIAAANRGHTRVLEWLWQKSLFTVEDLKKTARRASIFASQRADLDLLNWYHAKLAIHVPRFHWRFKERFLRQTARTEDVRVTQWWYMHSTAYIERMQLEFSLTDAGSVQGLEWLYEQGRLKIQHWGPLDMVLRAPTLGTLFFWIRYCTAHPDQVLFHWWPHLSSPTRPIYFETVWSIFEQRGHSVHDVFKNALARSKDPQLAVWLQAKVASLQN